MACGAAGQVAAYVADTQQQPTTCHRHTPTSMQHNSMSRSKTLGQSNTPRRVQLSTLSDTRGLETHAGAAGVVPGRAARFGGVLSKQAFLCAVGCSQPFPPFLPVLVANTHQKGWVGVGLGVQHAGAHTWDQPLCQAKQAKDNGIQCSTSALAHECSR